ADADGALGDADVEKLATAAYLVARDTEAIALWKRLHQELVDRSEVERAARCGFWLGLALLLRGQAAESRGWIGRISRLLENREGACVEQGYALVVEGLFAMDADEAAANAKFDGAIALADRFGDADLLALALLGRGQATIVLGDTVSGLAMMDEAMVAVIAGDVSPILSGILYCAAILTCQRILDVRRAREWTIALGEWCAAQPQSLPFRGECLVHRSEILQFQGEWTTARDEAERACEWLSDRTQRLAGRAFYQRGELHRLRGELDLAEEMYREALRNGYEPVPGVALLRLAQGQLDAAVASIRRVVAEARDRDGPGAESSRSAVLGPYVEIMLAADLAAARAAAEELVALAAGRDAPLLCAIAGQAMGSVLLEEGDAAAALTALREAWTTWQELDAPYESARVRVLVARACERLGDHDTAQQHIAAAAAVFDRLGALPDSSRLARLAAPTPEDTLGQLSAREIEVLVLVAAGKTNRQIAAELAISAHTVARHLSNIYNKIGVASRTAASAFAYQHRLVPANGRS
ncbi:MAG TPA: LuxR C-terminal-related transcriptional regulator, partial [Nannocystaceae bacterium]|nr:LuxR C-terminal-related transcriptional regulator [Nannocystaceae bacterium]